MNRTPELESEQRVAGGQLAEPAELRARQDKVESVAQQAMHPAETERADPKPRQPLLANRSLEVERRRACFRPAAASAETRQPPRADGAARTRARRRRAGRAIGGRRSRPRRAGTVRAVAALRRKRALSHADPVTIPPPPRRGAPRRDPWPAGSEAPAVRPAARLPAGHRAPRTRVAPRSSIPCTTSTR